MPRRVSLGNNFEMEVVYQGGEMEKKRSVGKRRIILITLLGLLISLFAVPCSFQMAISQEQEQSEKEALKEWEQYHGITAEEYWDKLGKEKKEYNKKESELVKKYFGGKYQSLVDLVRNRVSLPQEFLNELESIRRSLSEPPHVLLVPPPPIEPPEWFKEQVLSEYKEVIGEVAFTKEQTASRAFVHMEKASELTYEHDYKEAVVECNKAIEIYPQPAQIYFLRGNLLFELGDYEKALKDFTKALELPALPPEYKHAFPEPKKTVILQHRMITHLMLNKYDTALKDCKDMIDREPKNALFYFMKANLYYYNNEYESALETYNAIIESKDSLVFNELQLFKCYLARANAYFKLHKNDLVLADYNTIIEKGAQKEEERTHWTDYPNQTREGEIARAKFYFLTNKKEKALKELDDVISNEKAFYSVYRVIACEVKGDIYSSEGEYIKAAENYANATQDDYTKRCFNKKVYDKLDFVYKKSPQWEGYDYRKEILAGKDSVQQNAERGGRYKLLIERRLQEYTDFPKLEIPYMGSGKE